MTLEQLLLLAVFVLVPLLNLLRRLLRERGRRPDADAGPVAVPVPPQPVRVVSPPGPPGVRAARPARTHRPVAVSTPAATSRSVRRAWLNRRDARRGFVLMTVLGPCRGLGDS